MRTELPDTLRAAIEGYLSFFEMTTALGGALFGATIFLVIRAFGIIQDSDVAKISNVGLLLSAGLSAIAMIVIGFVAQNVSLSFYVETLRSEAFGGCKLPDDRTPVSFFLECHRKILRSLVWIDLVVSAMGLASIGTWFVIQVRRLSNEKV